MRKGCPFTHSQKKNRPTSPQRKEKGKAKGSDNRNVTVAIVNISNHRLRNTSGKLLQLETSQNTHLKANGSLVQVGQSKMHTKGILAIRRKLPSEQRSIRFSRQSSDRAEFRDKFLSLRVLQTSGRIGRSSKGVQSEIRSKQSLQGTQTPRRTLQNKDTAKMSTSTNFFRSYVPARRRLQLIAWRYIPKKECT